MSSNPLDGAPLSSLPERHVSSTFPAAATALDLSAEQGRTTAPPPMKASRSGPMVDRLFGLAAKGAALLTLAMLIGILLSLIVGAWPAITKYGLGFLTSSVWDPVQNEYGGLVMIYGTLATSAIALVIAVPVSFGIALFLTELSPGWLKRPLGTAIELLAAVPSIVYGMWGLLVFGPILSTWVQQPLQKLLAGVPYLGALVSGPRWASASSRPASSSRS